MKDKKDNTKQIKSIVKNLKFYNTFGGIALGVTGTKLVDAMIEGDVLGSLMKLSIFLWPACAYYAINKSLDREIDNLFNEKFDDTNTKDDNDSVNSCRVYGKNRKLKL